MSRFRKLYGKFLDGRPLTFAELQTIAVAFGFVLDRISGSHHIYQRDGVPERFTIQKCKGKDAMLYQVKKLRVMIATYGLTLDGSE